MGTHHRHYLREWRRHRKLTQEQVCERIGLLGEARRAAGDTLTAPTSYTHTSLSRIEKGLQPYGQVLLEILAEIYQTDVASLLMRDPKDPQGLLSIHDRLSPREREQLVSIANTIHSPGV
jgi:transcriptional regulator with XRE-family HTH domain